MLKDIADSGKDLKKVQEDTIGPEMRSELRLLITMLLKAAKDIQFYPKNSPVIETSLDRAIEAIARGQNRILLVMATGTGKTYTAFQIIWRLWKAKVKKRILFLADRNILVDQARINDFKPFGGAMTKITHRKIDKSYEIYLSLYQAVTGHEEDMNIYNQFSRNFFDLIIG